MTNPEDAPDPDELHGPEIFNPWPVRAKVFGIVAVGAALGLAGVEVYEELADEQLGTMAKALAGLNGGLVACVAGAHAALNALYRDRDKSHQ